MKHIHFIGICGVAMSAIAIAFKEAGFKVTGSDKGFYPPVSTHLKQNKIDFYPGWHVEKMTKHGDPDLIVVGNVAGSKNPEWIYVQENKLNYKSYPEVLAEYFLKEKSIVCSGTYGKTSTTTLLSHILQENNLDPSFMFGGLLSNGSPSAHIGNGNISVMEGDEYKTARWDISPKFSHYSPTHLLLTAVSWDHADIYPTEEKYFSEFKKLVSQIPKNGLIVANTDHIGVKKVITSANTNVITYGEHEKSNFLIENISQNPEGLSFTITYENKSFEIKSKLIGKHQAINIGGCFAMCVNLGLDPNKIIAAIKTFPGIKRRLENRYSGKIRVYDDIAHSPEKATSTLKTLREVFPKSKIIAVFEPNTGNRKSEAIPQYHNAFKNADTVIIPRLTKVKKVINDTNPPMDGKTLAQEIKKTHNDVQFFPEDTSLISYIQKNTFQNDVIVFLGSHGFRGMIEEIIEQ